MNYYEEDQAKRLDGQIEVFANTPKAYPRWRAWDIAQEKTEPGWTAIVIGIIGYDRVTRYLPGQWRKPKGETTDGK